MKVYNNKPETWTQRNKKKDIAFDEFCLLKKVFALSLQLIAFPESPFCLLPNKNPPTEYIITYPERALVTYTKYSEAWECIMPTTEPENGLMECIESNRGVKKP